MKLMRRNIFFWGLCALLQPDLGLAKSALPADLPDWIHHPVALMDSRPRHKQPLDCFLQLVEIPGSLPDAEPILLIPGLLHNARVFDLMPDQGVSFARHLRDRFALRVFVLNPRGIGGSCYPKRSNLDDLAIDDIPSALQYITQLTGKKLWALGHSQGGITLQAALGGLSRCGKKNCFSKEKAQERQAQLKGLILTAANVAMSGLRTQGKRRALFAEWLLAYPFSPIIDKIPADWMTRHLSPTKKRGLGLISGKHSFAYSDFWEYAYHLPNIPLETRTAFYNLTLDSVSLSILKQYAKGIRKKGIQNSAKEFYADSLVNIHVPTLQVAFEYDLFAVPEATYRDNFDRIGSNQKLFLLFPDVGHEDYQLDPLFQNILDDDLENLLHEGGVFAPTSSALSSTPI